MKYLGESMPNALGHCPRLNVGQSSLDFGKFKFNAVNLIQRLVLSYIGLCCVNRFDLSTLHVTVMRQHFCYCMESASQWILNCNGCFLMWKPYICDIKGRDVELATWNTISKPSIPIGSSFRKQRSTIFAHWGFGRGVSVGKTVGEGNRAFPRELRFRRECF